MPLCKLCKTNEVGTGGLICEPCKVTAQLQTKANLFLEDAAKHDWGLVRLSPSVIIPDPEEQYADAEVCGVWGRMHNGRMFINLETTLQALQDKAVLVTAEIAERRRAGLPLMGKLTGGGTSGEAKVRTPRQQAKRPEPAPQSTGAAVASSMQALRDKLRPKA